MAASDFTNIRAESIRFDQATVRYDYAGAASITLWRSTDDVTYSQVVSIPSDYGSYPTLYDGEVSSDTLYYYKLSDDAGATKTAAVTVKIQRQFPSLDTGNKAIGLPSFSDEEDVSSGNVDRMRSDLQDWINGDYAANPRRECVVCPSNGSLVLDCSDGCYSFRVKDADIADINSISVNCEKLDISFDIPEGTTTEICGWPEDSGFGGDECFQQPISSPSSRSYVTIKPSPCQVTAIRYPAAPCAGEYTKDCYDAGSLVWSGKKNNFSMIDCGAGTGSSCCGGNHSHGIPGAGLATIYSGIKEDEAYPTSGFSVLFGKSGAGSVPWQVSMTMYTGGKVQGQPRFGVCANVPTTATRENFTGLVLMLDYYNNLFVTGQYTNADLRAGGNPTTVYNQAALSGSPDFFFMENFPDLGSGIYRVYPSTGAALYDFSDSGHTAPSDALLGFGFFWLGNNFAGVHAGTIKFQVGSDISVWHT